MKIVVGLAGVAIVCAICQGGLSARSAVVTGTPVTPERGLTAADDPVALVRAYLTSRDPAERAAISEQVAAHSAYRPSRLRGWLHQAMPFAAQTPGRQTLTADVGAGITRRVSLIVPDRYRPDRAWPLIYALHPSGQPADDWAGIMQRMLGARAQEFLIASPDYDQNYIAGRPPFVPEHAAILDAVARRLHVDAGRVYPFGYSMGGFAAWYVSLYHPDRVAGAISAAAGFDVAPTDDGFWKVLVPNVAHVPVLNIWGERDALTMRDLTEAPVGTFADSNRRFEREVRGMRLPITNIEVPGGAHNDLLLPREAVASLLTVRRTADPERVAHTFRHLHQASSYWLEGLTWVGDRWSGASPPPAQALEGESPSHALARTIEPLLGRLTGEIAGQTIRVTRRHIGEVVIWFGESTIDWNRPVTIEIDGRTVFAARLDPDVGVALARAAATMDFDVLRFAGVRLDASGRASVVTDATMPEPVWKSERQAAAPRR